MAARLAAAAVVLLVSVACPASGAAAESGPDALRRYAADTWRSFVAMTDTGTGLPADSLHADGTRSVQTSTTNIGAYMWSALVAERLGSSATTKRSPAWRRPWPRSSAVCRSWLRAPARSSSR